MYICIYVYICLQLCIYTHIYIYIYIYIYIFEGGDVPEQKQERRALGDLSAARSNTMQRLTVAGVFSGLLAQNPRKTLDVGPRMECLTVMWSSKNPHDREYRVSEIWGLPSVQGRLTPRATRGRSGRKPPRVPCSCAAERSSVE